MISVIIPTYNRAKTLRRAINSVIAQRLDAIEIIIVDDGSTDDTESVIKQISQDFDIRYIRQENKGVSAARNQGIKAATGDFVAFLDSDDEWLENKLERQLDEFEKNSHLGMICADDEIRADGKIKNKAPIGAWLNHENHYYDLLLKNFVPTSSVIVRREVFDSLGFFDESLICFEDYDMWLRISEKYKVKVLSEKLSRYYENSENSLYQNTHKIKRCQGAIRVLEKAFLRKAEAVLPVKSQYRKRLSQFYFDLASAYYKKGDFKNAFEAYRAALKNNPLNFKGSCFLALTFLQIFTMRHSEKAA